MRLAPLALLLLAALLAACAYTPPAYYPTPAPGEAGYLAAGTITAVYAAQQATIAEHERQAAIVGSATAQAASATQQAVAVTYAAVTAEAAARQAATSAAVTGTAAAQGTAYAIVAQATRDAGWEATRRLKADGAPAAIPVIALTAHAMSDDEAKARAAGCDDFDTKPVELKRLLAKIERWLPSDAEAAR